MTANQWARIKELFDRALGLPADQRAEFLSGECSHEEGIGPEVERLLLEHGLASSFLETPAHALLVSEPRIDPGKLISGRFRILRYLGSGGMGDVYEARDEYLGESTAMKMLRPEIAIDPANYDRLLREVTLARRISHPNVCRIFDLTQEPAEGALTFMTMELLQGETLTERLGRTGPLTPGEALPLLSQLAAGLAGAHRSGVVHRDLKSANIFLAQSEGGSIRSVITDFGMARTLEAVSGAKGITQSGTIMGTIAYMAPEQLAGDKCTFASDVYSFGVMMLESLTGKRALAAASCQNLPPLLAATIVRCLQPAPDARFADGEELLAALVSVGQHGVDTPSAVVLGRKPLLTERNTTLRGRSRRAVITCGVVMLSLALFYALFRSYRHDSKIREGASVLLTEVRDDTGEPNLAGLTEVLRNEIAQSPYFNVVDQSKVRQTLTDMSKNPETALSTELAREVAWRSGAAATLFGDLTRLGSDYLLSVRIEMTGAEPQTPAGHWTKQFESPSKTDLLISLQNAATWVRGAVGEAPQDIAAHNRPPSETTTPSWEALNFFAQAERLKAAGRENDAVLVLDQALEHDPDFVLARMRKGDILVHLGKLHDGFQEWRTAIGALKIRRVTLREELRTKGLYALDREDFPEAVKQFKIYRAQFPRDDLPYFYLARPLMMMGRTDEALESLRAAARINPATRYIPFHIAMYHIAAGHLDLARNYIQQLRDLREDGGAAKLTASLAFLRSDYEAAAQLYKQLSTGPDEYWRGQSRLLLACLLSEQGRYHEAAEALNQGLADDAHMGKDQNRAQKLLALAYVRSRQNDRQACRHAALEASRLEGGVECLLRAGSLLARSGFLSEASHLLSEIDLDDAPKFFSARHRLRGEILLASGRTAEALKEMERATGLVGAIDNREPLARALIASGKKNIGLPILEHIAANPGEVWQAPENELPGFWADTLFQYGRLTGSKAHLQQYLTMHARADGGLPEIAECRRLLDSQK